ncbi:MAG: hypothetical protein ABI874_07035 [Chloroflexota bacterium]
MRRFRKLLRPNEHTKTRFHNQKGDRVDFAGMIFAPQAVIGNLLKIHRHYIPTLPWLSFNAIRQIGQLIQKDWKVLEFGSGMSTIWFAQRCSYVHSIESDQFWYDKVRLLLAEKHLATVRYDFRTAEHYADVSEYEDQFFDFILVDGMNRSACIQVALKKIKRGGYVYLDNSDGQDNEMRTAERLLSHAVDDAHGWRRYFTDFAPCLASVTQGCLARL